MATQEKEKFNPGDLVRLNSERYIQKTIDDYGLGLCLKCDNGWHCVYWPNLRVRLIVRAPVLVRVG
jgi:hypothetical protein